MKLEFKNVTKEYHLLKALDDVSFEAMSGKVITMLGPNGAGKSTLIRLVAGLIKPSSGGIFLDEEAIFKKAKVGIGLITPKSYLYSDLTVAENLRLYSDLNGAPDGEWQKYAKYFNLTGMLKKIVRELSHGQKQRAALARVMLGNPELLLLDEPFLGLDAEATDELISLIKRLRDEDKMIFVATHQFELADLITERLLVLQSGRIIYDGAIKDKNIHRLYNELIRGIS